MASHVGMRRHRRFLFTRRRVTDEHFIKWTARRLYRTFLSEFLSLAKYSSASPKCTEVPHDSGSDASDTQTRLLENPQRKW
jgi:hypothetical protein